MAAQVIPFRKADRETAEERRAELAHELWLTWMSKYDYSDCRVYTSLFGELDYELAVAWGAWEEIQALHEELSSVACKRGDSKIALREMLMASIAKEMRAA